MTCLLQSLLQSCIFNVLEAEIKKKCILLLQELLEEGSCFFYSWRREKVTDGRPKQFTFQFTNSRVLSLITMFLSLEQTPWRKDQIFNFLKHIQSWNFCTSFVSPCFTNSVLGLIEESSLFFFFLFLAAVHKPEFPEKKSGLSQDLLDQRINHGIWSCSIGF